MYNQIYSISSEFVKSLKADKNYFFLNESGVHFIDSTPVSTCLNRRIFSHKVTSGFASRGKSSKGWFYGFKPHGVCSEKGVLESVVFTSGNINDSKMVEKVTENMKGWFYCDAGYLKKMRGACQACRVRPPYLRRSQTEHEQDYLKRAMAPSQKTEHH